MDKPTVSSSGYIFNYDAIKSYIIHFNKDPISKKQCNIDKLITITNNNTYQSIIEQSFVESNNLLNDINCKFHILNITHDNKNEVKKMLRNIINMASRYNKSEYTRLTNILDE